MLGSNLTLCKGEISVFIDIWRDGCAFQLSFPRKTEQVTACPPSRGRNNQFWLNKQGRSMEISQNSSGIVSC